MVGDSYDFCNSQLINLNPLNGNIKIILERSLPSYVHCTWIVSNYYANEKSNSYLKSFEFSLQRQGKGIDNVRICNIRSIPKYYIYESSDTFFTKSPFYCGIDISPYIKKGFVNNVSSVDEFLSLKVIDYEYIGPPYQNYFSFSFYTPESDTAQMNKNMLDLNKNLNSIIQNMKNQTNFISNISSSTLELANLHAKMINKTSSPTHFQGFTSNLENDSKINQVLSSNSNNINQNSEALSQNIDSKGATSNISSNEWEVKQGEYKDFSMFFYILLGYSILLTGGIILVYCLLKNLYLKISRPIIQLHDIEENKYKDTNRIMKLEKNEGIEEGSQILSCCSICKLLMNEKNEKLIFLSCNHRCHFKCMKEKILLKEEEISCYLCKSNLQNKDLMKEKNPCVLGEAKIFIKEPIPIEIEREKGNSNMENIVPSTENLEIPSSNEADKNH